MIIINKLEMEKTRFQTGLNTGAVQLESQLVR